jgi:hypothetical protein
MDADQERARRHAIKVIDERLRAFNDHLITLPIDHFVKLLDQHQLLRAESRPAEPHRD